VVFTQDLEVVHTRAQVAGLIQALEEVHIQVQAVGAIAVLEAVIPTSGTDPTQIANELLQSMVEHLFCNW